MTREEAIELLYSKLHNQNLRRHCLAVEAVMRALARRLGGDEEKWGLVGLLHDGDYEATRDEPEKHTLMMYEWLKEKGVTDEDLLNAILSHNYAHTGQNPPSSPVEWALYCCDDLTGLIVAVALVMPDRRIASVTVESIMKKWKQKSFAAGVNRDQIEECEDRLGISLEEFIEIALTAMQSIAKELGL